MASAQWISDIDASYVQRLLNRQDNELIRNLFLDFDTRNLVKTYGNVDRTLDIGVYNRVKSLVTGYTPNFTGPTSGENFTKATLTVADLKADFLVISWEEKVQAFNKYLQAANIVAGNPSAFQYELAKYLMAEEAAGIGEEFEIASWMGIAKTTGATAGDPLIEKIDGYRKQAATLCNANGAVVTTGAIDNTNAVTQIEKVFRSLDKRLRIKGADILVSYKTFDDYKSNWFDLYKQAPTFGNLIGVNYEFIYSRLGGGKTRIIPIAGLQDDDAVIGTRLEWLGMGFEDITPWKVQEFDYTLKCMKTYKFGVTLRNPIQGMIVVNDRLVTIESTRTT